MTLAFDGNMEGLGTIPIFWKNLFISEGNASTNSYIPNQLVNSIHENVKSHVSFTQSIQEGIMVSLPILKQG